MFLLYCFAVPMLAVDSTGKVLHHDQDLSQKVVRLEEKFHIALHKGDYDRITQLLPQAERLEAQLLEILEDTQKGAREKEGLLPLLEILGGLCREADLLVARRSWRRRPEPRIEYPPDSKLISVSPLEDGRTIITGAPGAVSDVRARIVRVVNLSTSDQAAALVGHDGSFRVRLADHPGRGTAIGRNRCGVFG